MPETWCFYSKHEYRNYVTTFSNDIWYDEKIHEITILWGIEFQMDNTFHAKKPYLIIANKNGYSYMWVYGTEEIVVLELTVILISRRRVDIKTEC